MVQVIGVEKRTNNEGEDFCLLVLQGGIEMVQSKETGRFYATVRKAKVSCTFDERTAKSFIGSKMNGTIQRIPCEAYEFETQDGETIELSFKYGYFPEPTLEEVVMGNHTMVEA